MNDQQTEQAATQEWLTVLEQRLLQIEQERELIQRLIHIAMRYSPMIQPQEEVKEESKP